MSLRPRSEALVISALINTGDAHQAQMMGVLPEMFSARQAEYRWCIDYQRSYGTCPTPEALERKFPGFPYQPDKTDVVFYVEELIYDHNHRALVRSIKDAATYVSEGDLDEAILTMGRYQPHQLAKPLPNALHSDAYLETYDEHDDCLLFPWQTMQEITGGMRQGELYYLAARLGQGKSWTMTNIIGRALLDGRRVKIYSLEMSEQQVLLRMHVWLGRQLGFDVDHVAMKNKVFDRIAYRKILGAIKDEVPGELFIQDTSKGVISPLSLQGGQNKEVDLIAVDHVGLMHTPTGGRSVDDWRAAATISNMLKEVALGQNSRILSAAQVNREGDTGKWPPKLRQLAQTDALGQDADCVITHRRWGRGTMVYSIEKTRDGYSEVPFFTKYEPNVGVFDQISRDEAEDRWEEEKLVD